MDGDAVDRGQDIREVNLSGIYKEGDKGFTVVVMEGPRERLHNSLESHRFCNQPSHHNAMSITAKKGNGVCNAVIDGMKRMGHTFRVPECNFDVTRPVRTTGDGGSSTIRARALMDILRNFATHELQ